MGERVKHTVLLGRAVHTDDKPAAAKANRAFRKARAALLSAQHRSVTADEWAQIHDVLAAKIPDVNRTDGDEGDGTAVIGELGKQVTYVQNVARGLVEQWISKHTFEVRRREEQERYRGVMRVIMRAWREQADGRPAAAMVRKPHEWNAATRTGHATENLTENRPTAVADGGVNGMGGRAVGRECGRVE